MQIKTNLLVNFIKQVNLSLKKFRYTFSTFKIKLQLLLITKHFSCFCSKFSLLDPDPGGEMNADPDPQPSLKIFVPILRRSV